MILHWRGPEIAAKAQAAAVAAVDETMIQCVRTAQADYYPGHGYEYGVLQGSVKLTPAQVVGAAVVGVWGSYGVKYAIYVELGTGRMAGQHQLTKAADKMYPRLASKIRQRMKA